MEIEVDIIVKAAIKAIRDVHKMLRFLSPMVGSNRLDIHRTHSQTKLATASDVMAEAVTNSVLHQHLRRYKAVIVGEELGEEHLNDKLDFTDQDRLVVLLDMIDGTDLFERHLSNWCSAMTFFHPAEKDPEKRIVAAFVALPDEVIYYATRNSAEVKKVNVASKEPSVPITSVTGPSNVENIGKASIAFYGQKIRSFLSVVVDKRDKQSQELKLHPFITNLIQLLESEAGGETRIYTLGGNPMMMRLIDGEKRIDCLFNLSGSAAHDAIPGLYIAQKGGAVLRDLNGVLLSNSMLSAKLMKPADKKNRVSYVLASTEKLADEMLRFVTVPLSQLRK